MAATGRIVSTSIWNTSASSRIASFSSFFFLGQINILDDEDIFCWEQYREYLSVNQDKQTCYGSILHT
jgi:hypothetical protein